MQTNLHLQGLDRPGHDLLAFLGLFKASTALLFLSLVALCILLILIGIDPQVVELISDFN